jgi:uncharacterized membrane protein YsdA (DUF1294 family)
MSDTARLALTLISFGVSLLTGLAALALLAAERRRAGRALRRWQEAGGSGRPGAVDELVVHLLGNPFDRSSAVVLLVLSLVTGAVGHFLGV